MDAAEKRRLEREKRQARIRASGSNRLAKITGAAGTQDYKPPVETAPRASPASPAVAASPATPAAASPASLSPLSSSPSTLSPARSSPGTDDEDPLLAFLKQNNDPLLAMLGNGGAGPAPAGGATQAQAQQRSTARVNAEYGWMVAYALVSAGLGLYAAWVNPWAVTKLFVAVHVAMVGARVAVGHHSNGLPMMSTLAPFLSMLPVHRQRQLSVAGGVVAALRAAYLSLAVVVFVYGLATGGGAEFARPY